MREREGERGRETDKERGCREATVDGQREREGEEVGGRRKAGWEAEGRLGGTTLDQRSQKPFH